MQVTDFLHKWKESLEIFSNKNLKLFCLAVLNTFRRSFLILFKRFWFLTTLAIFLFSTSLLLFSTRCMDIFSHYAFCKFFYKYDISMFILNFVVLLFALLLEFFLFLIVRPSVQAKNKAYFISFAKKFLGFALIVLLLGEFELSFLFPLFYLVAFFYLDSYGNIKSFIYSFFNTFLFVFYFLPALIIFGVIRVLFRFLENWLAVSDFVMRNWVASFVLVKMLLLSFISFVLFPLFFLSIISVYYTKIKHKNFKLFYK